MAKWVQNFAFSNILRGKINKPTHEKGGFSVIVVPIDGTDEFENRYNEDFTHLD
jgi:3'-phosphoadenosine 5'-phosphosulfate (PAPS) 3'-phosphatase